MKMKKLCSTVLLAAIAAGVAAPLTASAAAESYDSKGSITYEQKTGGDTGSVTDPEEGEDIDEPTPNPDKAPLMIIGASDLVFGQDTNDTSETLVTFDVQPFEKVQEGMDTGEYTPHFVEFRDVRSDAASVADRQYNVSAAITSPFTTTGGALLKGVSITYNDIGFQSQKNATGGAIYDTGTAVTDYNIGSGSSSVTLQQTDTGAGASAKFLSVDTDGTKAQGRFHIVFGTNTTGPGTGTDKVLDDGVQLTVPAGQTFVDGTYTATITWTIAATP